MIEYIKQKWLEWLVALVLIIITSILAQHFTVRNNSKSLIQQQIDNKADKDYVDRQDDNIQRAIRQHAQESEKTSTAQMELIKSMDSKLNILINRQK